MKTLRPLPLALALGLTFAGAASAQSSVTLYGLADVGLNHVSGQEPKTRMSSGIMEGSRWGLRGTEDLGGGYKAIFVTESRIELDTGANSNRPASGTRVPDRFVDLDNFAFPLPLSAFGLSPAQFLALPAAQRQAIGAFTTTSAGALAAQQATINQVAAGVGQGIGVNLENRLFDRQAFVGLVTPFGALLMGRQYTPGYEMFYRFDAMQTESSLSAAQIATLPPAIDIRRDNTIAYRVEKDGWVGTLSYSFGERPGSASEGRFIGANAYYRGERFGGGVAYNGAKNSAGDSALRNIVVGAYADLGPGRLSALAASAKDDNPDAAVQIRANLANPSLGIPLPVQLALGNGFEEALRQDSRLYHLGYRITSGRHTVTLAYNHLRDRIHDDADVSSYGAVYSYGFSKRTDINLVLTRFNNDDQAQAAPGGNGFFGGVTSEAGRDATNFAIALRHRF